MTTWVSRIAGLEVKAVTPAAGNAEFAEAAPAAFEPAIAEPLPAANEEPARPFTSVYAPIRVLPVDRIKKDSIIPDIKLGSRARLKLYGLVKASLIYDTSSPSGTDMPLPYLNTDTGPTVAPEFHVRARNVRLDAQFEWLDFSPNTPLTGRFETDFEGSYARALNRNISSLRSSQLSLRVAWGRVDRAISDKLSVFALVGQDWTPFGSSTLPNLLGTTGLGFGYGTLYERLPQARVGLTRVGGSRKLKLQPEFAVTMPAFGDTPANVADQLGYGERQGADSGCPERYPDRDRAGVHVLTRSAGCRPKWGSRKQQRRFSRGDQHSAVGCNAIDSTTRH